MRRRRERARRAHGDLTKLVRFSLGDTRYAFEVAEVSEVVQPAEVTPLPNVPLGVLGVTDHRGAVVPIVDLRARFGLPPSPVSRAQKWVLVRTSRGVMGFLVDRVVDVLGSDDRPGPAPALGHAELDRVIRGVITVEGELAFVLEVDALAAALDALPATA